MILLAVVLTFWAVRDRVTKGRLSYRYRLRSDALAVMAPWVARGDTGLEVCRTTQDLPKQRKLQ